MRLGCCAPIAQIGAVQDAGFDYIEGRVVGDLKPLEERSEFEKTLLAASGASIKAEVFNIFLPRDLKVTGDDVNMDRLMRYVESAMYRAAEIGAEIIVFGSGGSRSVPEGFPRERALEQLREFLRAAAPVAERHGIKIALEPLRREECNIINTVAEADELSKSVGCDAVGALADLYHMAANGEPMDAVIKAGSNLIHVHTAEPVSRSAPQRGTVLHAEFFRALKAAGYDSRISLECRWNDFASEAPAAVRFLKEEWEKA